MLRPESGSLPSFVFDEYAWLSEAEGERALEHAVSRRDSAATELDALETELARPKFKKPENKKAREKLMRDRRAMRKKLSDHSAEAEALKWPCRRTTSSPHPRAWWLYEGRYFSTPEFDLQPDEVLALIRERENKKRVKIARAKAVAAMADRLDQQGQRQHISREVKVAVWQRDGGRCCQCGSTSALEFDHIIPVSMGGGNTERNIQLLCEPCNREKGASL